MSTVIVNSWMELSGLVGSFTVVVNFRLLALQWGSLLISSCQAFTRVWSLRNALKVRFTRTRNLASLIFSLSLSLSFSLAAAASLDNLGVGRITFSTLMMRKPSRHGAWVTRS